jgi:hypothetical protein
VTEEHGPEVVKWYTRARKFPQMIGRTPDGAKLPGGPYTVAQAVAAGAILVVGLNTMSLWARFGLVGNMLVLATVTVLVVWSLGRVPVGSRSPFSVVAGVAQAVAAPTHGRIGGRAVRIPPPRQLRHRVVFAVDRQLELAAVLDPIEFIPTVRVSADVGDQPSTPEIQVPRPSLPSPPPIPPALLSVQITSPETARAAAPQAPSEPLAAVEASESPAAPVVGQQQPARAPLTGVQALLASSTAHGTSTAAAGTPTPTLPEESNR